MASSPTSATSTIAQLAVGAHHRRPCCAVGAEADRLAVHERDQHLVAAPACLVIVVERAVVEDVAVLVDLDERRAAGGRGRPRNVSIMCLRSMSWVRATKRGLGAEGHDERVERRVDRAERRRLGDLAELARRRVLALGQPVDLVVEQQDREVDVAAQGVDQVVAADRQAVAVAGDHPHVEVGPGHGEAGGDGRGAAVDRCACRRCSCSTGTGSSSRCRDEHGVLGLHAELGHQHLDGEQDAVVAATRAPAHLLVAGPVLLGRDGDRVGHERSVRAVIERAASVDRRPRARGP